MKLFHLDCINVKLRYCAINPIISCISELIEGSPAKPVMEEDGEETLDLALDTKAGGLDLGDYVSNLDGILPLRKQCATAIAHNFDMGAYELLPARLIKGKNQIYSDDYVVLNPLGEFDCLNQELSEMDGSTFDPTVQILGKWCLHASKIPAQDLFRVRCVEGYIFSERLVAFILSERYKNFQFIPVEVC